MITHSELATLAEWLGGEYRMMCFTAGECLHEAVNRINALRPERDYEHELVESIIAPIENFTVSVDKRFLTMKANIDAYIDKHIDALRAETAAAMDMTPPSPRRGAPQKKQPKYRAILIAYPATEDIGNILTELAAEHGELVALSEVRGQGQLAVFKAG